MRRAGAGDERDGALDFHAASQQRPVRYAYALTDKGRDLSEVLTALARWGKKHVRGTVVPAEFRKKPKR
jgi:DNA-binding HxlR family transcriptional regulator